MKTGKELFHAPGLHFLLKTLGVDRTALFSTIANLGYEFNPLQNSPDIYVRTNNKLMSLKEMVTNFKTELINLEDEALYGNDEVFQLNKIALRQRIRNLERNSTYISDLIRKWGSPELLTCFETPDGTLDKEFLLKVFFDIRHFSEISELNEGLAYSPAELQAHPHLVEKLKNPDLIRAIGALNRNAPRELAGEGFSVVGVGRLISLAIEDHSQPQQSFKALEQLLFLRCSRVGLPLKALLVGRQDFLDRLTELAKQAL